VTLRLNGSTSGYTEIDAPAVAGSNTITLPTGAGSAYQVIRNGATAGSLEFTDKIVSGTAVASTSGTAIDFTGIPSWVKRVTVMFNEVSGSGTSPKLVQLGAGSIATSGYASTALQHNANAGSSAGSGSSTAGLIVYSPQAADLLSGLMTIVLVSSNTWVASVTYKLSTALVGYGGGSVTLSGTLDRVRITTVNGTDTFDAGSINILYE
jgi:hypothetical protein